ncbi:hypothetical protein BaRGS_00032236 [Batillaria attramentaria]|uniref:Uncharacterized protein n=1 Tax=Batillaria attramentaria TaxID=370345 RepID=A0ABD0JP77_9CAEN
MSSRALPKDQFTRSVRGLSRLKSGRGEKKTAGLPNTRTEGHADPDWPARSDETSDRTPPDPQHREKGVPAVATESRECRAMVPYSLGPREDCQPARCDSTSRRASADPSCREREEFRDNRVGGLAEECRLVADARLLS